MEYNDERRVYELGYHMVPTLTEEELQKEVDSLHSAITELGGAIVSEGEPTQIELAYTMIINDGGKNTKYDTSYFGWIKFDIEPVQLSHLQDEVIAFNKNIIRHLLIKTVAEDTQAHINLNELKEVKSDEVIEPPITEADGDADTHEEDNGQGAANPEKNADELDDTIDKLLAE